MSSPTASILLFDVMNTLVYDPIVEEIPAFFDMSLDQLYDAKHPTAWQQFERGELDPDTFYRIYFPDHPEPIDGQALQRTLYDAYRWLPGIEPLLEDLADRGFDLHAFSNYPVWYRIIEQKLNLSRFLDWTFVSCKTGVRKPDERAYRTVLRQLDVPPTQCLFIDDRRDNCTAARRVGIDAVVFEDADQLRKQLQDRGIL